MKKNKNTTLPKKSVLEKNEPLVPYFCTACSQVVAEINQAFVLDEKSSKYFCSEECIVNFHDPFIQFFKNQEKNWRADLACEKEKLLLGSKEQKYWLDIALSQPDEVWLYQDAVGTEYFCLIKKCGESLDSSHVIVLCHLFHLKPSFIFHHVFTRNFHLLEKYRWGKSYSAEQHAAKRGEKSQANTHANEVLLSKDLLQEIELLRSQLLSELIMMRSDEDIPLEGFSAYEKYIESTIEQPDETFEYKTKDGQLLLVNISDQQEKSKTLYYFVLSMKITPEMAIKHTQGSSSLDPGYDVSQPMIIPVLAFPSLDLHIYQFYKKGHCVNKRSLN